MSLQFPTCALTNDEPVFTHNYFPCKFVLFQSLVSPSLIPFKGKLSSKVHKEYFQKKKHFLPPEAHTYVKNVSFSGYFAYVLNE